MKIRFKSKPIDLFGLTQIGGEEAICEVEDTVNEGYLCEVPLEGVKLIKFEDVIEEIK